MWGPQEKNSVPQAQPWGQNLMLPASPCSRASRGATGHGLHLAFSCPTSASPARPPHSGLTGVVP